MLFVFFRVLGERAPFGIFGKGDALWLSRAVGAGSRFGKVLLVAVVVAQKATESKNVMR